MDHLLSGIIVLPGIYCTHMYVVKYGDFDAEV